MVGRGKEKPRTVKHDKEMDSPWQLPDSQRSTGEILPRVDELLDQVGSSKDGITKYLKKAAGELEGLQQNAEGQRQADSLANALQSDEILHHRDKDVQLCAVRCFCHILRVYAPDTPFDNPTLLQMFQHFLGVLQRVENPTDPMYATCLSVLDVAVQTKCYLLLLDLAAESEDANSLVVSILTAALEAINEENARHVEDLLLDLVSTLLMESDHISQEVLDVLLSGLAPPKADDNPSLNQLTVNVIRRAEQSLQPVIQGFLTSVIEGKHTGTELKDVYHHLIYQVYCISPQTMLPILPRLAAELQLDQESKRLSALQLIGKLLAQPNSDIETSHFELVEEFSKRAVDQKAEIRQAFLKVCPLILSHCSERTRALLQKEVRERLMDFDEGVRISAVAASCKTASLTKGGGVADLEQVALRLRDKKLTVRKETATQLMSLFRDWCSKYEDDTIDTRIPLWLVMLAFKDKAQSQWMHDNVLKLGLVSTNLDPHRAAHIWAAIASNLTPQDKTAFNALLKAQASIRVHLASFCKCRGEAREETDTPRTPPSKSSGSHHLPAAISGLARAFADHHKAVEAFQKLRDQKDKHIFRKLEEISGCHGLEQKAAEALIKELSQRLGGRTIMAECCKSVCTRLYPGILPRGHIAAMIEFLITNGIDDDLGLGLSCLLIDAAAHDPHLFVDQDEAIASLLDQDDDAMTRTGVKLLAKAGAQMKASFETKAEQEADGLESRLPELEPMLKELTVAGPPKTAKYAVRALHAIMEPMQFRNFLSDSLNNIGSHLNGADASLLTKLEVFSCAGRLSPDLVEPSAALLVVQIMTVLLNTELDPSSFEEAVRFAPSWAKTDPRSALEIARGTLVKVLARSFVPDNLGQRLPTDLESTVKLLDSEISFEMEIDADMEGSEVVADSGMLHSFGYRRLCAALGLMRLSRRHDSLLSTQTYFKLALTMQDPMTPVRAGFAAKLIQLTAHLHSQNGGARKASKYAAILALGAMDPVEQNQSAAFAALQEYVVARRHLVERAASRQDDRLASASAASGNASYMLHERPEFMLPFLVQILAHHPDLPAEEELTQGSLDDFLQPFSIMLQFALQTLLLSPSDSKETAVMSYAMIVKLLRTIKTTDDANTEPMTHHVHLMCDLCLVLARHLLKLATNQEDLPTLPKIPGGVPLPQQLFRSVAERRRDAARLQGLLQDFRPTLDTDLLQRFYKPVNGKTASMSWTQGVSLPLSGDKPKVSKPHPNSSVKKGTKLASTAHQTPSRAKEALQSRESSTKRQRKRSAIQNTAQMVNPSPYKQQRTEAGEVDSDKENKAPQPELSKRQGEGGEARVERDVPSAMSDLAAPPESPEPLETSNKALPATGGTGGQKPLSEAPSKQKPVSREVQKLLLEEARTVENVVAEVEHDDAKAPLMASRTRRQAKGVVKEKERGCEVKLDSTPPGEAEGVRDVGHELDFRAHSSQELAAEELAAQPKPLRQPKKKRGRPPLKKQK